MKGVAKKIALSLGLVTILVGLILISTSNSKFTSKNSSYNENQNQRSISMDFEGNETIGFSFRPHGDWSLHSYDIYCLNLTGEPKYARYLEVHVNNSDVNYTQIRIVLVITSLAGGPQAITVYPDYFEAFNKSISDYQRINSSMGFSDLDGAVIISKGYPKTEKIEGENVFQLGKAPVPGTYNLTLVLDPETVNDKYINGTTWIHPASPPAMLRIYKTVESTSQPYMSIMLPAGTATIIVGTIITVWSTKRVK